MLYICLMKAYIYIIKNLVNSKVYVGSSKRPNKRKWEHFSSLNKGKHPSCHLQKAYSKYGREFFEFSIIEECTSDIRKERELHHISTFKSHLRDFGYNIDEPNESNFTCSAETREKIRATKRSRPGNHHKFPCRPVDVYSIKTLQKVATFPSVNLCETSLQIPYRMVGQVLSGRRKSYKGFTFVDKDKPCNYIPSSRQRDMSKFYK